MRGIKRIAAVSLVCFLLAGWSYGQEKAAFVCSGRNCGTVPAMKVDGKTYVNVQKAARKLGAGIELYARSKQAKISARGFYAILTAASDEYIMNARVAQLSAPVREQDKVLWVPAEFFLLPAFQQAVGKEISFQEDVFYLERPFDIERLENVITAQENQLVFSPRKKVTWTSSSNDSHAVDIRFPQAVIKRDEQLRLKTPFIHSVSIRQHNTETRVHIILGKQGKNWKVEERDGKIIFRVAQQALTAQAPKQEAAAVAPAAPAPQPAPAAVASAPQEKELPAKVVMKSETPVMTAVPTTPVLKPAPVPTVSAARKKMRIVVDPGHGGKDPGAIRSRTREKDLNLAVSKELFKLLKKGGFEVKITRDNDTFIPLSDRSKISNTFKADLFVSVHTNSSKNRNANGFEVYFRSEKATDQEAAQTAALENEAMQYEEVHYNFVDALLQSLAKNEYINESSKLAGYVRNAIYKQPGIGIAVSHNNSVRQANFYVLKGVQSPAILVEMGYISSNKDRGRLTQSKVQKNMAQGIYNGIYNYAKQEGWLK